MDMLQLGANTWCIKGRVNIGYYEENGKSYLIDTGLDDEAGRKCLRLVESRGLPLAAIINTHSNADHIGGNSFIQKRTGCEVWTTRFEALITESPNIEPMFLWGGFPFAEIRGKFMEAKPSKASVIPNEGKINDTRLTAVPLPGHFLDMIGVFTPDNVLFVADALFDPFVLQKYFFMVMLDVAGSYKTFDMIENFKANWFVPCHAAPTQDVLELVAVNRRAVRQVSDEILEICASAATREEILSKLATAHDIKMDAAHLLLNHSCVSAHLTWLSENGHVEHFVENAKLYWRAK